MTLCIKLSNFINRYYKKGIKTQFKIYLTTQLVSTFITYKPNKPEKDLLNYVQKLYICTYKYQLMDSKLTLKLDNSVIEQAKTYAKMKNTSLSKLVESYLGLLVEPKGAQEVTQLVKSLSGVLDLPKDLDYKKDYKKHLANKYTK